MAFFTKAIQEIPGIARNAYKHVSSVTGRHAANGLLIGGAVGAAKGMLDGKEGNLFSSTMGGAIMGGAGGYGYRRLAARKAGGGPGSPGSKFAKFTASPNGDIYINPELAKKFPNMFS